MTGLCKEIGYGGASVLGVVFGGCERRGEFWWSWLMRYCKVKHSWKEHQIVSFVYRLQATKSFDK